jgi:hypothetical protein
VRSRCATARAGEREAWRCVGVGVGLSFAPPPACRGRLGGGAFDLRAKSNPTPTLPCKQGREHFCRAESWQGSGWCLASLLLWLLLLCTALDPASSNSARRRAPLYRGPCAAVRCGRQAPKGESTGRRFLFASTRMCCRKARPHLTHFLGRMPRKRCAGCRFLLVTSLLDKQKRSNSPSEGGRNALKVRAAKASTIAVQGAGPLPAQG